MGSAGSHVLDFHFIKRNRCDPWTGFLRTFLRLRARTRIFRRNTCFEPGSATRLSSRWHSLLFPTMDAMKCAAFCFRARCFGSSLSRRWSPWTGRIDAGRLDYSRKEGGGFPIASAERESRCGVVSASSSRMSIMNIPMFRTICGRKSTSWPMVSRPTSQRDSALAWGTWAGYDTLKYLSLDPVHRQSSSQPAHVSRHVRATAKLYCCRCRMTKSVHLKARCCKDGRTAYRSLAKANDAAALFGYQFALPGKKLLFMGARLGGWRRSGVTMEASTGRCLIDQTRGAFARFVSVTNQVCRREPALSCRLRSKDSDSHRADDRDTPVLSFCSDGRQPQDTVLIVCNFTPVPPFSICDRRSVRWLL